MTDQPNLDDIQGIILRSFSMPFVRHLVFTITDATAGAAYLGQLVDGDGSALPQVTPATAWTTKPSNALALGITHDGLAALGLPKNSLVSFPVAYQQGAVKRAEKVGDIGTNAPDNWQNGFDSNNVHLILSVYGVTKDDRENASNALVEAFTSSGAGTVLSQIDGNSFPDGKIHFGYTDGISNPNIAGMTPNPLPDDQPQAPPGEFFLGYPNQFTGGQYPVPKPSQLGTNGSYYAFRVLAQDVPAFEQFLQDQATQTEQSSEWIAAKLVGRWRNGNPLELTPDTADPSPPIPSNEIDKYNYVKTDTNPDDTSGARCPIGSHMRRTNPRAETVAGGKGAGSQRRIMRRATPYGPVYKPDDPNSASQERGLIGPFIVGDIAQQFEFVMNQWVNQSIFTANLPTGSGDPILSNNSPNPFQIVMDAGDPINIETVPQFVFTKGSAYCFMPSMTALRYLADPSSYQS